MNQLIKNIIQDTKVKLLELLQCHQIQHSRFNRWIYNLARMVNYQKVVIRE